MTVRLKYNATNTLFLSCRTKELTSIQMCLVTESQEHTQNQMFKAIGIWFMPALVCPVFWDGATLFQNCVWRGMIPLDKITRRERMQGMTKSMGLCGIWILGCTRKLFRNVAPISVNEILIFVTKLILHNRYIVTRTKSQNIIQ